MISVIIPYWNAGRWIKRCADSLITQQGDFEFIFVDDFSTDDPAFNTDSRCILTGNRHSKGVSGARNTGLEIAQGEWITFLDADDELLPRAEHRFKEMQKVDAKIHQANHLRHYVELNRELNIHANRKGMYDLKRVPKLWFGVWNKLYKHSLIEDIRFIEGMQYGEDEMFNIECLERCPVIHCSETVTVRHNVENKESLSHSRTLEDLQLELNALRRYKNSVEDYDLQQVIVQRIKSCKSIMGHEQSKNT